MARDLLEPSLKDGQDEPIYSGGILFATAFFGGGIAVTGVAAENARRLGRLRRDAPLLILGLLITLAVLLATPALLDRPSPEAAADDVRLAHRAIGFVLWLGYYRLHRREQRAMQIFGRKADDRVRAAFLASVAGFYLLRAFIVTHPGLAL